MAQLARATGIVLRTQNHAETDRIAVLLTPGEGRLDVLAKGARRLERASGAALDELYRLMAREEALLSAAAEVLASW